MILAKHNESLICKVRDTFRVDMHMYLVLTFVAPIVPILLTQCATQSVAYYSEEDEMQKLTLRSTSHFPVYYRE